MLPRDLPPLLQHLLDMQPSPAPVASPRYENAPSAQHQEGMAASETGDADGLPGVELVFEDPPLEDAATGSDAAGWAAGVASTPQLLDDPAACNLDGNNGADTRVPPGTPNPLQHLHSIATSLASARQDEGAAASNGSLPAAGGSLLADVAAIAQACTPAVPAAAPPADWPASHTAEQPQLGWQQQASVRCPAHWSAQQRMASCQTQALAAGSGWGESDEECIPIIDDDNDDDDNGGAATAVSDGAAGAIQTPSSPAGQQSPPDKQQEPPDTPSVPHFTASDTQAHQVPCSKTAAAAAAGTTALPWSPTASAQDRALQRSTADTL